MEREEWLDSADPRHAAAAWHALMQTEEFSDQQRHRFADWLCQAPTNVAEYLRLVGVQDALRDPAVFAGISLPELQQQIGRNVQKLPRAAQVDVSSPPRERRWSSQLKWAVPAIGVAAAVVFGFFVLLQAPRYSTAIGEQRSVVLPDGSIAELNTQSAMQVRFTAAERDIILSEGAEALFRVAKDAQRPFRVHSAGAVVQAVGTEFTVRREADRTTVTVIGGRVRIMESHDSAQPVELVAGQRLALGVDKPMALAVVERVDPQTAIAWKTRRLVFDDLPLATVIAEFNRYNEKQIDVTTVPSHVRRITGVFNANDPESFVQFLKQSQGQLDESAHQGRQNP